MDVQSHAFQASMSWIIITLWKCMDNGIPIVPQAFSWCAVSEETEQEGYRSAPAWGEPVFPLSITPSIQMLA